MNITAFLLLIVALLREPVDAFQVSSALHRDPRGGHRVLRSSSGGDNNSNEDKGRSRPDGAAGRPSPVEEYRNAPTKILSNFMNIDSTSNGAVPSGNPIDSIDFGAPKFAAAAVDLDTLATILDHELIGREWFVTGNVNPIYFSDAFEFEDPDVKLNGIEDYARGVRKLFSANSRAAIISTVRNDTVPDTITCTWRLSGGVNIGPGLTIKPYVCYTDFTIDRETNLIVRQEDRFSIPQWDILLSALFPFLIGRVTSPPAPPVEVRVVPMPDIATGGK